MGQLKASISSSVGVPVATGILVGEGQALRKRALLSPPRPFPATIAGANSSDTVPQGSEQEQRSRPTTRTSPAPARRSASAWTPRAEQGHVKHAFSVGDKVTWTGEDADVPPGDIGDVVGHETNGKAMVRFSAGQWSFHEKDLVPAAAAPAAAAQEQEGLRVHRFAACFVESEHVRVGRHWLGPCPSGDFKHKTVHFAAGDGAAFPGVRPRPRLRPALFSLS